MKIKKHLSRLTALLLVLAMVLSMSLTAFAAEEPTPEGEGISAEPSEAPQTPEPLPETPEPVPETSAPAPEPTESVPETTEPETSQPTEGESQPTVPEPSVPETEETAPETESAPTEEAPIQPFNAMMPFTLLDLEGYSMEMEGAQISVDHFKLEAEGETDTPCKLHFDPEQSFIPGGKIADSVPLTAFSDDNQPHTFVRAHVGKTQVYYMGTLTIQEDGVSKPYIYYTTDTHITNKTVYAVLKPDEQISLVYTHETYYDIDYQLVNADGGEAEDGWTKDQIFGEDRAKRVASGGSLGVSVTIPRGYRATVTVRKKNSTEDPKYENKLGEMMVYCQPNKDKDGPGTGLNTIALAQGSPKSMVLTDSFSINNITSDIDVVVSYEKVTEIKFSAHMWTTTAYANNRIKVVNSAGNQETPSEANSNCTFPVGSFTWKFDGISSVDNKVTYTWEMDQLQINGERIRVPVTTLLSDEPVSVTTQLSTGTEVTMTVKSGGGTAGRDGKRHYTLTISNCYEDLTISGGNMISNAHQEFAVYSLRGLESLWGWPNDTKNGTMGWGPLKQDSLIAKTKDKPIGTPFRFNRAVGYENMHVRFTAKNRETVLQQDGDGSGYIDFLIRNDTNYTDITPGNYTSVTYDEWKVSDDGFFYFRGTEKLKKLMQDDSPQYGVVLISIYADPIKTAIDYKNGADDGTGNGPAEKDIAAMPKYQNGGENGYNIQNNPTALVSNTAPVDTTGKFIFSHWEILTVDENGVTTDSKKDTDGKAIEVKPGDDIHVTEMAMEHLSDCLYLNEKDGRKVLTLKAVWEKSEEIDSIPYIVRYYLDFADANDPVLIEVHTHTVNKEAMLVTDLYKDSNGTISDSIMSVLAGDNDNEFDYTRDANWKIREDSTKKIDSVSLEDGNNIANIYLVEQRTSVTVTKTWDDHDNPNRPESVSVQLYKGNTPIQDCTATLSAPDWNYTFADLPERENGVDLVYSVQEVNTPENYTSSTSGFVITNTIKTGSLTVTKEVAGPEGNQSTPFNFKVALYYESGTTKHPITGKFGSTEFDAKGETTFSLKHGDQKTITGLPVGAKYEVTETEANENGYRTTVSGDTGTITEAESAATFVNTKGRGLTVIKTVVDDGGIADTAFKFKVELSDKTVNGPFGDMVFVNGVAEFTLTHDQSKTAQGLHEGITYTVTEEANADYSMTSTDAKGTLTDEGNTAAFINTKKDGTLKVSKIVVGNGDKTRDFTFVIDLQNKSLNNVFSGVTFTNGVAEIKLKDGESQTIHLPGGIQYTVTEKEADQDGYATTATGDTGTIRCEQESAAEFINEKYIGGLKVSKTVGGNAADEKREFHFKVTLSDKTISGQYGEMVFDKGAASFTLKHDESKTAAGLPAGVSYEVVETDANRDGYITTSSDNAKGTISQDAERHVWFHNVKSTGSLSVSKVVSGNRGSTVKAFTFTVKLEDSDITGEYGDMEFKSGVAVFTLKHGQTKEASGLPNGVNYTVTESDNHGYKVTKSGDTGTIREGKTAVVVFNNYKAYTPLKPNGNPPTGDHFPLYLATLTTTAAALTLLLLTRKRKAK